MPPDVPPARRRRWFLGLVALLIAGVTAYAGRTLVRPAPYAVAVLQIANQSPWLLGRPPAVSPEVDAYTRTQAAHLTSRPVLEAALRETGLADLSVVQGQADPVGWLADHLRVRFDPSREFMRVELRGGPPDELVAVLAAVVKAYLADAEERQNGPRRQRLARLEPARQQARAEADLLRGRFDHIAIALEALADRLGEEIERLKIELEAPMRVTLVVEPEVHRR